MVEQGIQPEQLYNADETALYWRMMPNKTLAGASETAAPGHKKVKDRVSLLACSNATGSHKLPLLLIGKSQNPRCFKHVNLDNLPVLYRAQQHTWMTSTIFTDWFKGVFVPKVKSHLLSKNLPMKAILLIDNCPAHPPDLAVEIPDGAIECRFLPPNTTSHLQPMDQGPLETMKRNYRRFLIQKLVSEDTTTTLTEAIKKLTLKDTIFMIDRAWRAVESHLQKSWAKSTLMECFSNLEEESETLEVDVQDADVQEIRESLGDVPTEDVKEWLECDRGVDASEVMSDEAILEYVKEPADEPEDQDEETTASPRPMIPDSKAYECISIFFEWIQHKSDFTPLDVVHTKDLRDKALRCKTASCQQVSLKDFLKK